MASAELTGAAERVVLFDGVCNVCSAWTRFVIAHDSGRSLKLASIQSDAGRALLARFGLPVEDIDTMVFIEDGAAHVKSTAFLRAVRYFDAPWRWLAAGIVVPRVVRDWLYDRIALNRYALFGKRDQCMVPTPEIRSRFL